MAAVATYKQFLASPSEALLADNATLHYVPTTTSIVRPDSIISHLRLTQKQIIKKKEEILHVVQGDGAIALETDTGLEFQTSGGPYLPGLDDNFLSDRLVFLPITHFVIFAPDGKILQIRLSWDQAALLKQLDIIGKTGRNWPIKDSKEQIVLIQNCLKIGGITPASSTKDQKEILTHARGKSTNALRDPHATLHMRATREEVENRKSEQVVSPYGGARPHQRSFTDVLGDQPEGPESSPSRHRNMSPAKAGSNKHFQPMRIFDGPEEVVEEQDTPKERAGSQYRRPNPRKYDHFDFADGSDPQDAPTAGVSFENKPKTKHDSQWSFDDFTTPSKPRTGKVNPNQEERHWDTDNATYAGETPAQGGKGRRDAETHFELQDDGERVAHADKHGARSRGSVHSDQLGLYSNKLFDKDENKSESQERALGNITNLSHRGKDLDPHFKMTDDSPSAQPQTQARLPEGRQKAVKMMDANWSSYDESPKQKENSHPDKTEDAGGIHIAGDGMGGKKGAGGLRFGRTDEEDKGINIAGDGMGGKKGTNRDWLYSEEAGQELPKSTTHRKMNTSQQSSLWDF